MIDMMEIARIANATGPNSGMRVYLLFPHD